jgi:hypothetical protein
VAEAEGVSPVPLGLLRLLEEPFRDVVLDVDLRQSNEDARVPAAPGQDLVTDCYLRWMEAAESA